MKEYERQNKRLWKIMNVNDRLWMTEVLYSIRSISRLLLLIVAHILLAIFISFISFSGLIFWERVFADEWLLPIDGSSG